MFIFEKKRNRVWAEEEQRGKETQNRKQAPGSELSAQCLMWGLNPRTVRSRPELKSDTELTESSRHPPKTGNILKTRSNIGEHCISHLWQLGLSILQNHCLQSVKEPGLAQWMGFLTEETVENSFPPAVHTVIWLLLNSHVRINNEKLKHLQYLYFPLEKQMQHHSPRTIICDQYTVQK